MLKTRLKDVCDRITVGHVGPMADKYTAEGVPFLRSQNITVFRLNLEDLKYIPPDFHVKLRKSALSAGDVAVVRTGYPGTACVIPNTFTELNCADLVVITPSTELNPYYLAAIFNSAWGVASVAGSLVGVAQQHFNIGAAREMEIALPPRGTQDRIAGILSAYDELIETSERRIKILQAMARALFREWFVHFRFPRHEHHSQVASPLGEIPKGWQVRRIGDAFQTVLGGTPSRSKHEFWEGGTVPWVNSGKVNDLRIIDASELITPRALEKSAAKLMPKGTTVLAITGATLGQVSYLEIETSANQSVVGIVDPTKLWSEWVYLTMLERIEGIIKHASGGAQQHINKEIVNDVLVALPPYPVAQHFKRLVEPMFREQAVLLFQGQNLRRTRDVLLPRLLSGQIEVATA